MTYFELTMPLDYEWMPDEVLPIATHFYLGPKFHADKGFVVGSESGTSITLPSEFAEFRKTMRLDGVPIEKMFLRPTVVLDIPKHKAEEITEDDLDKAISRTGIQSGDAVLIRTGWGDRRTHAEPGAGYITGSPHLSFRGAGHLASRMVEKNSDLLLTDSALVGLPDKHLIPEWCSIVPRPGPWPSPEAKVYIHLYDQAKMKNDFAVELTLARAGIMTVKRLIHCGGIEEKRIRIIVSPLRIVRGVSSTCRVIAVQGA